MQKNLKLRQGNMYAVHHGDYAGQMFCYINQNRKEQLYNFLSIPEMKTIAITQADFNEGMKNDLVKYVEKVPKYVFKVIEAQFLKNESINNRRK